MATIHRQAVAPENLYHHIIAVVPYTGKGSHDDPKRPMYLPAALAPASNRAGILGFTMLPSDDGKSAIVEYVAADRAAFSAIMADKNVITFEKGKAKRADIEAALQRYRKGFSLDRFGVVVR